MWSIFFRFKAVFHCFLFSLKKKKIYSEEKSLHISSSSSVSSLNVPSHTSQSIRMRCIHTFSPIFPFLFIASSPVHVLSDDVMCVHCCVSWNSKRELWVRRLWRRRCFFVFFLLQQVKLKVCGVCGVSASGSKLVDGKIIFVSSDNSTEQFEE